MPDIKLQEADKECIYRQALAGRPMARIVEDYGITARHARRIIKAKRGGNALRAAVKGECWVCKAPAREKDVFCSPACKSAWNEKAARDYFERWLSGGQE